MIRRVAAVALTIPALVLGATPSMAATSYDFRIAYATPVTSWGVTYIFAHQAQTATFKGTVLPRAAGKGARLQESTDGGRTWKSVVATTTDSLSHVVGNISPVSSRDYSWALVPDATTASSRSATIRLTVFARLTSYPNCAELNQRYPHGVGKPNAADSTSSTPVRNFLPDATMYSLNDGGAGQSDLDRDNDGIACEKA